MAEYQVIDINGLDHYDSKLKEQIRTKLDNYYTKNIFKDIYKYL